MTDILSTITARRRLDVAAASTAIPTATLLARAQQKYPAPPLSLSALLLAPGTPPRIAAEFKRASPSKGPLAPPTARAGDAAAAYTRGGAAILSVLTEPHWFKGSLEDMEEARLSGAAAAAEAGSPRPLILRKDFVIDSYQLAEARAYGADTVLLIVACLTPDELAALIRASRELGMEPLVEVNCVEELGVAIAAGATVLGVNNRNLRTFVVDLGTTARVVAAAGAAVRGGAPPLAILSLSGIKVPEDGVGVVHDCLAAGASGEEVAALLRGFLIGEALMTSADPTSTVAGMVAGAAAAGVEAGKGSGGGALPPPPPRPSAR